MDKYDIEIIRLLVRDKGGVMERRSWKSICKALVVVQKPTHNRQSAPCLHVESLFVNKAGFDECRICGHVFRN